MPSTWMTGRSRYGAEQQAIPKVWSASQKVERPSRYKGGGARCGRVTAFFGINTICVLWPEVDIRTSSSVTSGSSVNPGTHFRLVGQ